MPSTPDHSLFLGVKEEKLAIQKITTDICKVKELNSPAGKYMLNNMSKFDIGQFVYHRYADLEDFFNSHLLLQKSEQLGPMLNKLTMSDILNSDTLGGI